MYSPKELEGEVDHSFFDSDCDEQGKEDRGDSTAVSGGNAEGHEQMEPAVSGEGNPPLPKEDKSNGSVDDNRSRPSSASSLLSFEEKSEADDELDKNPSTHVQITAKIPTGLSAEENGKDNGEDDDEDGYKRSEEDTEEESDQKPTKSKAASHCLSKKSSAKFRIGKHSPVSSSKSDSSYSSTEDSSASEASPRRNSACSPPPYRAKPGALARREKIRLPPEESEDTVTDVTPLSTPNTSPVQSFELALRKDGERERVIVRQQNVLGGLAADDVGSISEAFMKVNKRLERELVIESSGRSLRKNYSFSNDDVVRIDRENQRLLQELSRRSPRPKSGVTKKPCSPPVRPCHSALNRQREQQRIERENMAFLKRLESAKATPGMKRSEQLSDYQRQARYLGAASPTKSERSPSSRSSAGKSSRLTSASSLHRARPASSVSTAVSKTSRTAWP